MNQKFPCLNLGLVVRGSTQSMTKTISNWLNLDANGEPAWPIVISKMLMIWDIDWILLLKVLIVSLWPKEMARNSAYSVRSYDVIILPVGSFLFLFNRFRFSSQVLFPSGFLSFEVFLPSWFRPLKMLNSDWSLCYSIMTHSVSKVAEWLMIQIRMSPLSR